MGVFTERRLKAYSDFWKTGSVVKNKAIFGSSNLVKAMVGPFLNSTLKVIQYIFENTKICFNFRMIGCAAGYVNFHVRKFIGYFCIFSR
jgi:hypothetical protein